MKFVHFQTVKTQSEPKVFMCVFETSNVV